MHAKRNQLPSQLVVLKNHLCNLKSSTIYADEIWLCKMNTVNVKENFAYYIKWNTLELLCE
jgi:hypothetical protein